MVVKKHTIYLYIYSSVEPTNKNMYNTIIHRTYNTLERRTIKQWYYKIYKYMFIIPYKYKCHLTARGCDRLRKHYQQLCQGLEQNDKYGTQHIPNAYIQDVTYKIPFTLLCNSYLGIVVMYCDKWRGGGGATDTSISLSLSINTESQRNIFNINAINFSFRFNK